MMALIFVLLFGFGYMIQAVEGHKFAESVTLEALKFYLEDGFPKTGDCYEEQKERYEKFGTQLTRKMVEISDKIGKDLKDYPMIKKKVQQNLKRMSHLIETYPQKLWLRIKSKNYGEASKVMERNRKKIETHESELKDLMLKLRNKSKKVAETVEAKFVEVQNEATETSHAISLDLFFCVSAL